MRIQLACLAIALAACSNTVDSMPVSQITVLTPEAIDDAYAAAISRTSSLRYVNLGRTLGEDELEAWYEGDALVLARATYYGVDGESAVDFYFENEDLRAVVRQVSAGADTSTYFDGGRTLARIGLEAQSPEALIAWSVEIRATLRQFDEGSYVPPPVLE